MATKTISITEETYEMLASWKRGNESFSDVIRRLGKKSSLSAYAGMLGKEGGTMLENAVRESRSRSRKRYA